jgi:MFS family permease
VIPARWKSGLSDGQQVGEILGLAICGLISERLGYRRTMLIALTLITGFIFILFFSPNVQVLLVGEILCGIPWGYEPLSLRSRPTATTMGVWLNKLQYLPDNYHCVRVGGRARRPAPVPHHLREHVLGLRPLVTSLPGGTPLSLRPR